jgi:hypothetical protein
MNNAFVHEGVRLGPQDSIRVLDNGIDDTFVSRVGEEVPSL